MRWYKIVLGGGQTWDATQDPNALNVEMDIMVAPENAPKAGSFVRVWGIPLNTLLQANKLTNQTIEVYGGMQKGLPLANPNQQGLLVRGKVFPALGNWVGTDMTLDLYIPLPLGAPIVPQAANVIHNMPKSTKLGDAVNQSLKTAYPGYTPVIKISEKLVRNYPSQGFYQTLGQYATFLFQFSKSIISDANYMGVHVTVQGKNILVDDGTQQTGPKTINFQDLIGQPIWTGTKTVQFKTVMRGDFKIGDVATLPKSLATLTNQGGAALPGSGNNNLIQGSFKITQMRHTGNFRQPDWPSWATTFDAIKQSSSSGDSSSVSKSSQGGIGHA